MEKDENKEIETQKLTKNDLMDLLGFYFQILPPRWQGLQTYISMYITLLTAILGITIFGFNTFKTYPMNFILELGPILILFISRYAKQTIKRQNEHIKEAIAMIAKIEYELGLYEKISLGKNQSRIDLWPEDHSFILPRWVKFRTESGKSSEEFIQKFPKSSAKYAFNIFTVFQFFSILLIVVICFFPLWIN